MSNIILHKQSIDGEVKQTISARELHEGLGVGRDFTNWFKDQIKARKLIENIDYVVFAGNGENIQGGRPRTEYFVTIRAAKHIVAMSRTEGGDEYREALFDLEESVSDHRFIQSQPTRMDVIKSIAEEHTFLADIFGSPRSLMLTEMAKDLEKHGINAAPYLLSSPDMDNIQDEDVYLEPTELGKRFSMSGMAMNKTLEQMGLQAKIAGEWVPTDASKGICSRHNWTKGSKSGYNLKWSHQTIDRLLHEYLETSDHG